VYSTNLTADKETGLGGWTDQQIADAIQGTSHGYRNMTRADALAIADYLKSISAIKNKLK
jgi:hypothetical protein